VRKNNSLKEYCKRSCPTLLRKIWRNSHRKKVDKSNYKTHFRGNPYSEEKQKYAKRLMGYKDSPTGKAYIGFAKQPLMPNDNGIGFKGVKLQSENRELLQCYECGRWLKTLGGHLKKHKLTAEAYKRKYGLRQKTGLVSDIQGLRLSEQIVHVKKNKAALKKNLCNFNHNARLKRKDYKTTMEQFNEYGTCPAQLKQQLIDYINRFKRLPKANPKTNRDGFSMAVHARRYGGVNGAFAYYGLPTRRSYGKGLLMYRFPDGTFFKTSSGMGFSELYEIMKRKCPVLTTS